MKIKDYFPNIGYHVSYFPKFNYITGDVKATILLCQLLFWEGKQADPSSWVYKTQKELFEETGLTRREQETARKKLKEKGFLNEMHRGIPRKLYFRLDLYKIYQSWEEYLKTAFND